MAKYPIHKTTNVTGSYYKTRDEYVWTPGIYNIINRSKEPRDAFYNIIFDSINISVYSLLQLLNNH